MDKNDEVKVEEKVKKEKVSLDEKLRNGAITLVEYLKRSKNGLIFLAIYPFIMHYILAFIFGGEFTTYLPDNLKAFVDGRVIKVIYTLTHHLPAYKWFLYIGYIPSQLSMNIIFEWIIIVGTVFVLYFITGKFKTSITIVTIFNLIFAIVNKIVFVERGLPFVLSDITVIGTAVKFIDKLSFNIEPSSIIAMIVGILFIFVIHFVYRNEKEVKSNLALIPFLVFGFLFIFGVNLNYDFASILFFNPKENYLVNGQVIGVYKQLGTIFGENKRPDGYSKEKALEILERYPATEETNPENVNVIFILDEAYSDLRTIYDLDNVDDYIPYYNSLTENTMKGLFKVAALGGQTANVEWEVLTGNTMAFQVMNSMPFISNIKEDVPSVVREFNDMGYNTTGFHSYDSTGYSRTSVYDRLGFKNRFFKEDMEKYDEYLTEDYPTDRDTFKNFMRFVDINAEKQFSLIVTMQNHYPYGTYNGDDLIMYSKFRDENSYFNRMHHTDIALEEFLNELKNCKQKTIVVFFGDHQPAFIDRYKKYEDVSKQYYTSYMIWANYDIEEKQDMYLSPNFVPSYVLDLIGKKKSSYDNFVSYVHSQIYYMNHQDYTTYDGNTYLINDKNGPCYDLLNEYKIVQYYHMYDEEVK